MGLRMSEEEELLGADLLEHDIGLDTQIQSLLTGVEEGQRTAFGFRRRSPSIRSGKRVIHVVPSEHTATPQPPIHLTVSLISPSSFKSK